MLFTCGHERDWNNLVIWNGEWILWFESSFLPTLEKVSEVKWIHFKIVLEEFQYNQTAEL